MKLHAPELVDITRPGPRDSCQGVRAKDVELRPWLVDFPICQALNQFQIIHVGIQKTSSPMRIVRTRQTTTYFLACHHGRGRVFIDGRWRICGEGYACLLPAHILNAFEALPRMKWEFSWVCYQRPSEQRPFADLTTPVIARFDPMPLQSAILGLIYECKGLAQPTLMQDWAELIHAYVLRFAQPTDHPDQLRMLWELVVSHLKEDWSLDRLAHEAGYSYEHLRRLCRRQLGRSPMQQVTYLRMRRAAQLLATTDFTIEAIAYEIGYHNPFVFSNAFTKWIGFRPSEYRKRKTTSAPSSLSQAGASLRSATYS